MIPLTRLDGTHLVVNLDHVLTVESTPDTMLTLTTGARLLVKEPLGEVISRATEFKARVQPRPVVVARKGEEAD